MAEIDGVAYDDVAVMYRTTAQSRAIEEALRFRGIPYQVIGGVRFYERKEVKDVLGDAPAAAQPGRQHRSGARGRQSPHRRGLGPRALEEIRTWAVTERRPMLDGFLAIAGASDAESTPNLSGNARSAARRVGSVIASLRDTAVDTPLTGLFDAIVERTGYGATFDRTEEEDLDRWANILSSAPNWSGWGTPRLPRRSLPIWSGLPSSRTSTVSTLMSAAASL